MFCLQIVLSPANRVPPHLTSQQRPGGQKHRASAPGALQSVGIGVPWGGDAEGLHLSCWHSENRAEGGGTIGLAIDVS